MVFIVVKFIVRVIIAFTVPKMVLFVVIIILALQAFVLLVPIVIFVSVVPIVPIVIVVVSHQRVTFLVAIDVRMKLVSELFNGQSLPSFNNFNISINKNIQTKLRTKKWSLIVLAT